MEKAVAPPLWKNPFVLGAGALVLVALVWWVFFSAPSNAVPGRLDSFAKCLSDANATMYGTFWCPHCNDQKKAFGDSVQFIRYVECSTPDGRGQLPECSRAGVQSYPTWEFADKSRQSGNLPLSTLAQKTGCVLP